MKKILMLVALFVYAESAYSLVGGQLFYGYRMQKKDDNDQSAHLARISAHVSPIPLVPVGLGVAYFPWVSYAVDKDKAEKSASGMELAVELVGWLPMVPIVTPYAKINYTVWGHKKTTYDNGTEDNEEKVSGMEIGAGVSYDVLPLVSVVAEVSQGLRKIEDAEFNATTLSIGVEVGI